MVFIGLLNIRTEAESIFLLYDYCEHKLVNRGVRYILVITFIAYNGGLVWPISIATMAAAYYYPIIEIMTTIHYPLRYIDH